MKMIDYKGHRLDEDACLILDVLNRQDDHQLNTSQAKTITGFSDNDHVRRRFERLADVGLVSLGQDEGAPTPIPPTQATLTDDGIAKAEEWDLSSARRSETRTVMDRLGMIENRLNAIDERVAEIEHAATADSDRAPELMEARRIIAALNDYAVTEFDADLGRYYPQNSD